MTFKTASLYVLIASFLATSLKAAEDSTAVHLPETIASDLSADVTAELNKFFADLPDGVTVHFPDDARYRIEGTVTIQDKKGLTIEGHRAFFRAFDQGGDYSKKENYARWRQTRNRAHFRIQRCEDVLVRNCEVQGAHPTPGTLGTYDPAREAQHGFDLVNVSNCTLEAVDVHDVYGDCVYMSKVRSVIVRDSKLTRCGRQGVAIATGEDILIENNEIANSRRGIIDIEPYGKEWRTSNIRIIGNTLGGSRLLLLPMGGSGTIGMVFIADNVNAEQNGTPAIFNNGETEQHRGPFMMVNNRFTIGGSPAPGLRILNNDGICLVGNRMTMPSTRRMTALDLRGSAGIVAGNVFAGAAEITKASAGIVVFDNTTAPEAEVATSEWKRIQGGFASRVITPFNEFITLMRGGPTVVESPFRIEAYGQSTTAEFAWFHLRKGKVISSGTRKSEAD